MSGKAIIGRNFAPKGAQSPTTLRALTILLSSNSSAKCAV